MRKQSNVVRFPDKRQAVREITRGITTRVLHEDVIFRRALTRHVENVGNDQDQMIAFVQGARLASRAVARRWLETETRSAIRFAGWRD
jgi:hypothetical protein